MAYTTKVDYAEHLVLVKGDIATDEPVLVRMHAFNILEDILSEDSPRGSQLVSCMKQIEQAGRGVIVVLRDYRPTALTDLIRHRIGEKAPQQLELRSYGIGAQILSDLGVKRMILMTNTQRHVVGLEGYGLEIVEQRPITQPATEQKRSMRQ
jgi:3,4-dihydroxy 2-butanone 4-phosphate synthase/GTP cyclohydrolase II